MKVETVNFKFELFKRPTHDAAYHCHTIFLNLGFIPELPEITKMWKHDNFYYFLVSEFKNRLHLQDFSVKTEHVIFTVHKIFNLKGYNLQ